MDIFIDISNVLWKWHVLIAPYNLLRIGKCGVSRMNMENWYKTKTQNLKCKQRLNVNCFISSFLEFWLPLPTPNALCAQASSVHCWNQMNWHVHINIGLQFVAPPLFNHQHHPYNPPLNGQIILFIKMTTLLSFSLSSFDDTDTVIIVAVVAFAIVVSSIEPTINCHPSGFLGPTFDRDHWHTNRIIHMK